MYEGVCMRVESLEAAQESMQLKWDLKHFRKYILRAHILWNIFIWKGEYCQRTSKENMLVIKFNFSKYFLW